MSSEQIELNERRRKAYDCTKSYILGQQIKAHLSDGRNLTGTLICIDRCKNMILTNVKEERYVNKSDYIYRITENNGSTTTSNDIHDDAAIDDGEENEKRLAKMKVSRIISQAMIPGSKLVKVEIAKAKVNKNFQTILDQY